MADTSLINVLRQAAISRLVSVMITEVTEEDTQAGLVRGGKLQANPTTFMKNLLVRETEDDDPHELFKDKDHGIGGFTFEVGGGVNWWRKFRIIFNLHFPTSINRDEAFELAHVILSRAEYALETMDIPGTTDSFGETCFQVLVYKSHIREGGGPGHHIWRGELSLKFQTEKLR